MYFEGCPHWQLAEKRLRQALLLANSDEQIEYHIVESVEEAEAIAYLGSPTVLVDGHDPFAEADAAVGFSCRLFSTPAGREGSPSVEQLVAAIGRRRRPA